MKFLKHTLIVLVPIFALSACGLSDEDRATLSSANANAQQASSLSQQAVEASHAATADSQKAEEAANQAAADSRSANEKLDRMFSHSLRKVR